MYIGVDTHKQQHELVGLDEMGRVRKTLQIPNTPEGWVSALNWARGNERLRIWGLENSGSLGKGFAQFLLSQGEGQVYEVSSRRTAQYRRRGRNQDKTDETDALAIARLLVAEAEQLPPVRADDIGTELRILSDHRENLLAERTRLINQLHAQMLQVDPSYRDKSGPLTREAGVRYCQDLQLPGASSLIRTRLLIVGQLCAQILRLDEEVVAITKVIQQRVRQSETPLMRMCGVGEIVAARLIGELGSEPRIDSASALAALAGISPVAVSSGARRGYRLNRGGNRRLNRAIHTVALSQRRCNPLAGAYYEKKRAEGKTKRAAMRCLKRQLVNVIYRLLRQGTSGLESQGSERVGLEVAAA